MDRGILIEEEVRTVQGQVAVDLIGGDMMIPLDAVLPAGVHQNGGADDIGLKEDRRIFDGTVHMGLRREITTASGFSSSKSL